MAKEIILTVEEIGRNCVASKRAIDAYEWALTHAGVELDEVQTESFVNDRNSHDWVALREFQQWLKKTADSIDIVMKHTMNIGSEEQLPLCASWAKQSFNSEWTADGYGSIVSRSFVDKGIVKADELLNQLTPSNIAKASGLSVDRIAEMYPGSVNFKPKARTLHIK